MRSGRCLPTTTRREIEHLFAKPRPSAPGGPLGAAPAHDCLHGHERYEAIGQRGEACIIVERTIPVDDGPVTRSYWLATGERLLPTETAGSYVTQDGKRSFHLRHGNRSLRTLPKPGSTIRGGSMGKRKAA